MAWVSGHNIYPAISVTAISLFYCLPHVHAVSSAACSIQGCIVHILWEGAMVLLDSLGLNLKDLSLVHANLDCYINSLKNIERSN